MKKIIPIMIAAAMLFAGCIVVLDTDSKAAPTDALYVENTLVSGDTDNSEWSYVSSSNTLTLKDGASLTSFYKDGENVSSPIYDGRGGTLKIVIAGNVSITGGESGGFSYGIFSTNGIEISGTGILTINNTNYEWGICAFNSLTVKSGTINIDGVRPGAFDIFVSPYGPGGEFTMQGGTINANATGDFDCNGNITVSGGLINTVGVVSATSGTITITGGAIRNGSMALNDVLTYCDNGYSITGGTSALHKLIPTTGGVETELATAEQLTCSEAGEAYVGTLPAATYTVSFDANGGTGTMDKKTGVSGEYTLPESTFTAPDGKEFKCWKVGEDEKNAGDKITVSSDITVKAVWKDKSSGGSNNIGLIIGGVIAGIVVVGAVAFFLIKRP